MELTLNLGWALVSALMIVLWLRFGVREGTSRRAQWVALGLLVLILFPVISVSDDLQAAQNPAEADCCVRRDYVVASTHSILPTTVALIQPVIAELSLGAPRFAVPSESPVAAENLPCLATIDSRPPPVA
jgi:hypothetical protein